MEKGKEQRTWEHKSPVRAVNWGLNGKEFLSVTDAAMGQTPTINLWDSREKCIFEKM